MWPFRDKTSPGPDLTVDIQTVAIRNPANAAHQLAAIRASLAPFADLGHGARIVAETEKFCIQVRIKAPSGGHPEIERAALEAQLPTIQPIIEQVLLTAQAATGHLTPARPTQVTPAARPRRRA